MRKLTLKHVQAVVFHVYIDTYVYTSEQLQTYAVSGWNGI